MSASGDESNLDLRVLGLFERVIELPESERSAWLDEHEPDPTTRARVDALLARDAAANGSFDPPSAVQLGTLIEIGGNHQRRIGAYRLESVLNSGGMGIVWRASQDQPSRTVALKLIRQGFSSDQAMRRFRFESEMLGRLDHSGIARIYGAGVHVDGEEGFQVKTPWFAMELVEGARSITVYSDEEHLSTKARVLLFIQVCEALNHAHQRGIIHRDIKPANLLVNERDEVKLIDFGASYADSDLATPLTQEGQLLGTLKYMSPEQLDGAREHLSTASDVYSLGVVLYELLCNGLPFEERSVTSSQVLMASLRTEDFVLPRKANPGLSRELEAIILKCLKALSQDRYATPLDLAEDLRRYLAHEPVRASRATLWSRSKLYARRHAGILIATAAVLAVALTGTVNSLRLAEKSDRNAQTAQFAERRAHLRAAGSSLVSQDVGHSRLSLDSIPEDQRSFLWWSFDLQVDSSYKILQTLSNGTVPVAISPDALSYVVATDRDMIQAYSLQTGARLWKQGGRNLNRAGFTVSLPTEFNSTLNAQGMPWNKVQRNWIIADLAFESNGKRLLLSSRKQLFPLDPSRDGEALGPSVQLHSPILSARASSDNSVRAVHFAEGLGLHLDVANGKASGMERIELGDTSPYALDVNGNSLAYAGSDGRVAILRDIRASGSRKSFLGDPNGSPITALSFNPTGTLLAVGRASGLLELWAGDTILWTSQAHRAPIHTLTLAADHALLASGSTKGTILVHGTQDGKHTGTYLGHRGVVTSLRFSPDGKKLYSASTDQTVRHWVINTQGLRHIKTAGSYIGIMQASESGRLYSVTHQRYTGKVQKRGGLLEWHLPGDPEASGSTSLGIARARILLISEEHHMAFIQTNAGFLISLEIEPGSVKNRMQQDGTPIRFDAIALSNDQKTLFAASIHGGLLAYSLPNTENSSPWGEFEGRVSALQTSPDGLVIAVGSPTGRVAILDANNGRFIREVNLSNRSVASLSFSATGSKLALSFQGGLPTLFVWSMESSKLIAELEGHRDTITNTSFHPTDDILLSTSLDGRSLLWDLKSQTQLYSWNARAWSPAPVWAHNGHWMAQSNERGTLEILHSRSPEERALQRKRKRGWLPGETPPNQLAIRAWKAGLERAAPEQAYAKALNLALKAQEAQPDSPIASLAIALTHFRLGNLRASQEAIDAVRHLQRSGSWPLGDKPTRILRALILNARGEHEQAQELYGEASHVRSHKNGLDSLEGLRRPLVEEAKGLFESERSKNRRAAAHRKRAPRTPKRQ